MNRRVWMILAASVVLAAIVAVALVSDWPGAKNRMSGSQTAPVKLAIGVPPVPSFANVILAHELGFFRDQGLDVTIKWYPTGAQAFSDMLAGKLDIALTADTPVAIQALKGKRFEVLATTFESGDFLKMVARRDRGISAPSDLAGKKLGVAFGTTAEFTQDSILAINRVAPASVVRVNLAPANAIAAMLAGEVDAVTIWAPYSRELINRLGSEAIVIGDRTVTLTTIEIVAPRGQAARRPDETRRMLGAIVRATDFIRAEPDRAIQALSRVLNLPESTVRADFVKADFTVALRQSLVVLLEDQARWAIKRKLVEATEVPNYLEIIEAGALTAVKPDEVSIIR